MSNKYVLELNQVSKTYNENSPNELVIFKKISLKIQSSELVGIIAPSGSGKTSLLNISGLLDLPTHGDVKIMNKSTNSLSIEKRNTIRRDKIGFVFQSSNLINEFNAIENVALSRVIKGYDFSESLRFAKELLKNVGLEKEPARPMLWLAATSSTTTMSTLSLDDMSWRRVNARSAPS